MRCIVNCRRLRAQPGRRALERAGYDLDRVRRGGFLIDGKWSTPTDRRQFAIVTPSDESIYASVPCADGRDIGEAVAAARQAFDRGPWPRLTHAERAEYLTRIADAIDTASTLFATLW